MPVIVRFYGITIRMYFLQSEHNPPHIHVLYSEYAAAVEIESRQILEGNLPPKVLSLVREWIDLNKEQLLLMWKTQSFKKLPPL